MKRIIVCGGRDYAHREHVFWSLDCIRAAHGPDVLIVHGDARGADTLAEEWARERGVLTEPHAADWSAMGPKAGPIRNRRMLALGAIGVVAFPGGRGTAHMVKIAREAGLPIWEMVP